MIDASVIIVEINRLRARRAAWSASHEAAEQLEQECRRELESCDRQQDGLVRYLQTVQHGHPDVEAIKDCLDPRRVQAREKKKDRDEIPF